MKARGTACPNDISTHFHVKWETGKRSLDRLCAKKLIFAHPEMGKSPMVYSIWEHIVKGRPYAPYPDISEKGKREQNDGRYVRLLHAVSLSDVQKVVGFVCHPRLSPSKLDREFVGAHWHGQFQVDIEKVGAMSETFVLPDPVGITGGWTKRKLTSNYCYYGHVNLPDDPIKFNIQSTATKDGTLKTLAVYVHRRYVYYIDDQETAMLEFNSQVESVLDVLRQFGWEFGEIRPAGKYSSALNSREFAALMPKYHAESDEDILTFDSSVGNNGDVCTEAEIVHDHATAAEEMRALVEAPARILALEQAVDAQAERITDMDGKIDQLITVAEKTVKATELTLQITTGVAIPPQTPYSTTLSATQEDVMYG